MLSEDDSSRRRLLSVYVSKTDILLARAQVFLILGLLVVLAMISLWVVGKSRVEKKTRKKGLMDFLYSRYQTNSQPRHPILVRVSLPTCFQPLLLPALGCGRPLS